jgi:hypothetical protein
MFSVAFAIVVALSIRNGSYSYDDAEGNYFETYDDAYESNVSFTVGDCGTFTGYAMVRNDGAYTLETTRNLAREMCAFMKDDDERCRSNAVYVTQRNQFVDVARCTVTNQPYMRSRTVLLNDTRSRWRRRFHSASEVS